MLLTYAGLLTATLSSGASFTPPVPRFEDAPLLAAQRGGLRLPRSRRADAEEDDDYGSDSKPKSEAAPAEEPEPEAEVTSAPKRSRAWLPVVIAGGALVAGGATCWGLALNTHSKLGAGDAGVRDLKGLDATVSRGKRLEQAGWGLTGAGLVGVGVGLVLALRDSGKEEASDDYGTSANLTVTRGGGVAAVFSGPLP